MVNLRQFQYRTFQQVNWLQPAAICRAAKCEIAARVKNIRRHGRPIRQRQRNVGGCQHKIGYLWNPARSAENKICTSHADATDVRWLRQPRLKLDKNELVR